MAASWGPTGAGRGNGDGKRSGQEVRNAVRKDGNDDEKVACSDDECGYGPVPLGHGRDGADHLLPRRGGAGEGDADEEPGHPGSPLAGGGPVAGRAGPPEPGPPGAPPPGGGAAPGAESAP